MYANKKKKHTLTRMSNPRICTYTHARKHFTNAEYFHETQHTHAHIQQSFIKHYIYIYVCVCVCVCVCIYIYSAFHKFSDSFLYSI